MDNFSTKQYECADYHPMILCGDVTRDFKQLVHNIQTVRYVYYMPKSQRSSFENMKIQTQGLFQLIDLPLQIKKIIYLSTTDVYLLKEPYLIKDTKEKEMSMAYMAGENILKTVNQVSNTDYLICRLGEVYGSYRSITNIVSKYILLALKNDPIVVQNKNRKRKLLYAKDAIRAINTLNIMVRNQTYNIEGETELTEERLAETIKDICMSKSEIVIKKNPIAKKHVKQEGAKKMKDVYKEEYTLKEGLTETIQYYEDIVRMETTK